MKEFITFVIADLRAHSEILIVIGVFKELKVLRNR